MPESPPDFQYLDIRRSGHVLTCKLTNPPRHTLTAHGVEELTRLLDWIETQKGIRVVVFTGGAEGVFIAHYEVGELAASAERNVTRLDDAENEEDFPAPAPPRSGPPDANTAIARLHPFHRLICRLEDAPFITIAALNGSAAGGGLELALGCDFRLMADGPFLIGLPETSVGIIPGAGGTQRFARLLGTARALDLILHAHLMPPREALELGLVHRVFAASEFDEAVTSFAEDMAQRAPIALAAAKRAIHHGSRLPLLEGLALEQDCFGETMRSKDAARAMRAFLSGESHEWQGE